MGTEVQSDNRGRARAFFERLADEESAAVLVEELAKMLTDAERRGAVPPTLSTDVYALSLVQGTVREKLAAVKTERGAAAFPPIPLNDLAANITTAVLSALDAYQEPDEAKVIAPGACFFCPTCATFCQWGTTGCTGPDEAMVGHCYGKDGNGCRERFSWPRAEDPKHFRVREGDGR